MMLSDRKAPVAPAEISRAELYQEASPPLGGLVPSTVAKVTRMVSSSITLARAGAKVSWRSIPSKRDQQEEQPSKLTRAQMPRASVSAALSRAVGRAGALHRPMRAVAIRGMRTSQISMVCDWLVG